MTGSRAPRQLLEAVGIAVVLSGCGAGPDVAKVAREPEPRQVIETHVPVPPVARQDPKPAGAQEPVGPEVLLPGSAEDAVVAKVGGREIRKSHVFDRLVTRNPRLASELVDLVTLDLLVADHAVTHRIRLDSVRIEALVQRELDVLEEGIRMQLGGRVSYEDYIQLTFAMTPAEFRQLVRLRISQSRFLDTVIRFMSLREDRVRVRYIANREPEKLREIADKVRRGADFGSLALQSSEAEDGSRANNGLLPPFGPNFDHPIVEEAHKLKPGEVSPVFGGNGTAGSGALHYLVYCVERLPGRVEGTYADLADAVRQSLLDQPRDEFETSAYIARFSQRLEELGGLERRTGAALNNKAEKR